MGGRGSASQNNSGSGKGTGKGKEILNDLLNGKKVDVRNLDNGVIFTIEHLGKTGREDNFKSTVKENPKNAHNPSNMLTPLNPGYSSISSRDLSRHKDDMINWLNRLQKV